MKTQKKDSAFTLVELLVVISIIALLAAIVISSVQVVLLNAKRAEHTSNLRQLWATVLLYANDNNGTLPVNKAFGTGTWQHKVVSWHNNLTATQTSTLFLQLEGVKAHGFLKVFNSPLNNTLGNMGFGSGGWPNAATTSEVFGRPLVSVERPANSIALLPYYSNTKTLMGGNWQRPGTSVSDISFESDNSAICAFVDGSVRRITRKSLEDNEYTFVYPSINQP